MTIHDRHAFEDAQSMARIAFFSDCAATRWASVLGGGW